MVFANFLGVQILGVLFGLFMLYLTILYFRRRDLNPGDVLIWVPVWIVFLIGVAFPKTLDFFLQTFNVISAIQLFTILVFMFFAIVIFYLYRSVRVNSKRVEKLVRIIALKKVKSDEKKQK